MNSILIEDVKSEHIQNDRLPLKPVWLATGDAQHISDDIRCCLPELREEGARLKANLETWRESVSEDIPADKFFKWLNRKFAPREPKDADQLNGIFMDANVTYQYLESIRDLVSPFIPEDKFYLWIENKYEQKEGN